MPFDKGAKRECVLLKSPFPCDPAFAPPQAHDELFDLPPINIESIGGKKTCSVIKLDKYAVRPDLFRPKNLPDSNFYQTQEF
jgi:hypothetical protein